MTDTANTITLTGRRPVRIAEDSWPVIAAGNHDSWDNQYRSQANRETTVRMRVRQHSDGRSIVYGTYLYQSAWLGEANVSAKAGELLEPGADICAAIDRVASELCSVDGVDEAHVDEARRDCIASLPAEEI